MPTCELCYKSFKKEWNKQLHMLAYHKAKIARRAPDESQAEANNHHETDQNSSKNVYAANMWDQFVFAKKFIPL